MTPKDQLKRDKHGRHLVPVFDIDPGGRYRKDMGDLAGLQDSIKRVGVIHSIVVDDKPTADNKWKLIAGGRRHMACTLAGVLEIPTDFFSEITELRLREIELDENGPRKDMEAMEQINLTAEIDSIKRKLYGDGDRNNPEG